MSSSSPLSRRALSMLGLAFATALPMAGDAEESVPATIRRPGARTSALNDPPPGVDIEHIAQTPAFAVGSASHATMNVARCRMSPRASIELVFGGSTLIVVESGVLTIEDARPGVSTMPPAGTASSTPGANPRTARWVPGTGGRVVVPEAGSAFAADGLFGSVRNEAADALTLLIVAVGEKPNAGDVTVVPVSGSPAP
jgi:hypothetical protein